MILSPSLGRVLFISLRDAALALLPFMFLRSVWVAINALGVSHYIVSEQNSLFLSSIFAIGFPLFLVISIAYHLALNFSYDRIHATILSLLTFICFSGTIKLSDGQFIVTDNFVLHHAVLTPILVWGFYVMIRKYLRLSIDNEGRLNSTLVRNIDAALPYIIIFFAALGTLPLLSFFSIYPFVQWVASLPTQIEALVHTVSIHLFWLTGIHGASAYYTFFDTGFVAEPYVSGIPFNTFFDVFVSPGGAGSSWSIILAILLFSRNSHARAVAKLSLPFALINVNELLLFGLPVIYNPTLAIPFLMVPLINQLLAQTLLTFHPVPVVETTIEWVTPVFFNSWMVTHSTFAVAVQGLLILLGVLLYRPFIMRFEVGSSESLRDNLTRALNLTNDVVSRSDVRMHQAQNELNQQQVVLQQHMYDLINGELLLYYQPQYCADTGKIIGMEALLRLKKKGRIYGPAFLDDFAGAGMMTCIDRWVIEQAAQDIDHWLEQKVPLQKVSINITADSLLDDSTIEFLITRLKGYPVVIEVTESSYIQHLVVAKLSVQKLRSAGIPVAIDDFGSGYSSLSLLAELEADIVKLDRQFLAKTHSKEGCILYRAISETLGKLNYQIIAEGVETENELALVSACGIKVIQGYYFSRPISKEELAQKLQRSNDNPNNAVA
ncbi:EAL domain-containing protein [Parasalinivibrio latis]|uniref:EAL domain-containing protein n=1 Tax=Parasalinivibrio latis TaxID=2952610 RepID=UPI0030E53546